MKVSSRRVVLAALALAATVAAYAAVRKHFQGSADAFVTEAVTRGTVASTVTATGTVNPVSNVQVGTYVSGPIKAIFADFNSKVTKGQLVAQIDPAPFRVKVESAEAEVANARAKVVKDEADLAYKKLTFERRSQLLERRLVAQNDLDAAKNDYQQAAAQLALDQAAVKRALADLDAAKINLGYTDITSPVDGVVVSRSVDVGQTVAASFQTPTLFQIAHDLTKMQVDTNVSESDIGGVAQAQPVIFRVDAYPGRDFHGAVVQVRNAPITVQNVVTYDVVIGVDNADLALRPGMTATVTITTASRADVLRVPLRALRFRPGRATGGAPPASDGHAGGASLWVVQPDGLLRRVTVRTGVHDDRYAELVAGELHENDALAVAYRKSTPGAAAEQRQSPPSFLGGAHRFH